MSGVKPDMSGYKPAACAFGHSATTSIGRLAIIPPISGEILDSAEAGGEFVRALWYQARGGFVRALWYQARGGFVRALWYQEKVTARIQRIMLDEMQILVIFNRH
ncbi:hypothetical protein FOZ63_030447, partial [Perkinsus olseni]